MRTVLPWVAVLLLPGTAWAGNIMVKAGSGTVAVLLEDHLEGNAPVLLSSLPAGKVELGFRATAFGPTVFRQTVEVPAKGTVYLLVDLDNRVATHVNADGTPIAAPAPIVVAVAAPAPAPAPEVARVEPASAPTPTPAPAPAPAPMPAPSPKPTTGALTVETTPAGAAVWLDGQDQGKTTPATLEGLAPGRHHVEVRTACGRAALDATVELGATARTQLVPEPGTGRIEVGTSLPGALVRVDGAEVGAAPRVVEGLGCGPHTVLVHAPDRDDVSLKLDVRAFETVTVALTPPPPATGTLKLDVSPAAAALVLDGAPVAPGLAAVPGVRVGAHHLEATADGFRPATLDVTVAADKETAAVLHLRPVPKPVNPKAVRLAVNVGVSAVGLAGAAVGAVELAQAGEAFGRYQSEPSNPEATRIYAEEVAPQRDRAAIVGGAGLAVLAAAGGLWITTAF